MKYRNSMLLAAGALNLGHVLAQACPAGYSPSVSYITVTATPKPEPSPTDECPAGHTAVVSYITVTASEADSATTIYTTGTTTSTFTVISGATSTASPVNAVENTVQAKSSAAAAATASPAASSSSSTSSSSVSALGSSLSGQATFYGGNVAGGTCSFTTYTLPSGIFGTALSDSNWDNAAHCGACVSVTGPSGNSITAMIVDQCPGCGPNHLDLFEDGFAALADTSKGVIDVTWEYVSCPISSPLEVANKDGSSAYWFSMQVVNAKDPVQSLEVSTDGGSTWQSTTRQTYNFFQKNGGFGTTSVDVKVISSTGDSVTVNNVQVSSGSSTTASSNF